MAKFMRKPEVIEAIQWFDGVHHPEVGFARPHEANATHSIPYVGTDQGAILLYESDWIITLPNGKNQVVPNNVFQRDYELVSQF